LWGATLASNVGTWMNDVGAGWVMTTLAPDPTMVALVQTATTLPVFLLALPAGAIADIFDRRRLLIFTNLAMAAVAAAMTVIVLLGLMTGPLLLLFTFLLGAGAAFLAPAWQAIVPSLVPREQLPSAIALNSLAINVSRAIGPALAGVMIVGIGLYAPFLANALSFVAIIVALMLWQPAKAPRGVLPPETLLPAIVSGVRYAWHSDPLKRVLIRALAFFVFASAYWALLPLVAREVLGGGSSLYGILVGCVGAGAVIGAIFLPWLRRTFAPGTLVLIGSLGTGAATVSFATFAVPVVAGLASLMAGASWIAVLSSLHVAAQASLPKWVRARGLSLFLTAFFGAMALGSLSWGLLAELTGIPIALVTAGAGAVIAAFLVRAIDLQRLEDDSLSASAHWPQPTGATDVDFARGPIMVTVRYEVPEQNVGRFLVLMEDLRVSRLRDGAHSWQIYASPEEADVYLEAFYLSSWVDHLRQHDRVTLADQRLQEDIRALCRRGEEPRVHHYIAADSGDEP